MKHHAFAAAVGLLIAALAPGSLSQAAPADPTGIWQKSEQGERPGKMEIFWCGRSKKLLCAKIVWLQDPNDSRGRPLRDIRNENASMRSRPIMGLPIFSGLAPTGPATWKGKIYNPEDGNTYSATLTLVSRSRILLKGCKAWLLCGERTWLRTSLPEPEPEPEPQIEASAEPEDAPADVASDEGTAGTEAAGTSQEVALNEEAEMLTPATPQVVQNTRPGYRFLNAAATDTPAGFSGENVPSMFAMTTPIDAGLVAAPTGGEAAEASADGELPEDGAPAPDEASAAPQETEAATADPVPAPDPKPKPPGAQPAAQANAAAPAKPKPAPSAQPDPVETAETAAAEEPPLTRRQRRLQRRKERGLPPLLPWLR